MSGDGIQIWIAKKLFIKDEENNYIEQDNGWGLLDLFEDETIELKSKLTDYKDLSKKFGDFTQDFDIPATANNNQLINYWYNPESNYQLQKYVPAKITIGGVIFKEGFLLFNKGTFSFTKIIKYNVEFTSPISSVKDILGNDKFENIEKDSYFQLPMRWQLNDQSIKDRLSQKLEDVYYPLIYHKEPIKVNPSDSDDSNYYITREHLRPAISFKSILTAIRLQYGITFTGVFMQSELVKQTYMLLNREENLGKPVRKPLLFSGNYQVTNPVPERWMIFKNYPNTPFQYFKALTIDGYPHDRIRLWLASTTLTGDFQNGFTIHLQRMYTDPEDDIINENDYYSNIETSVTRDSGGLIHICGLDNPLTPDVWYRLIVESNNNMTINSFNIVFADNMGPPPIYGGEQYNTNVSTSFPQMLTIPMNLPDMTIIDFLTSMMKMWNLIMIPTSTVNTYELTTYNAYQGNTTNTIDITKAIDVTSHEVEKTDYYSVFSFKHQVNDYAYNQWYKSSTPDSSDYGNYVEDNSNTLGKEEYTVETKFNLCYFKEYMMNPLQLHSVTYNDSGETIWNKPTIFFRKASNQTVKTLLYRNVVNGEPTGTIYEIPYKEETCNVLNRTSTIHNQSITWSNDEITPWYYIAGNFQLDMNTIQVYEKNLFRQYYSNIITFLNNKKSRLFKMIATFTNELYHKVVIGSKVKIMNNVYKVEEINSNLNNGKTKLTLSNFYVEREGNITTD